MVARGDNPGQSRKVEPQPQRIVPLRQDRQRRREPPRPQRPPRPPHHPPPEPTPTHPALPRRLAAPPPQGPPRLQRQRLIEPVRIDRPIFRQPFEIPQLHRRQPRLARDRPLVGFGLRGFGHRPGHRRQRRDRLVLEDPPPRNEQTGLPRARPHLAD